MALGAADFHGMKWFGVYFLPDQDTNLVADCLNY